MCHYLLDDGGEDQVPTITTSPPDDPDDPDTPEITTDGVLASFDVQAMDVGLYDLNITNLAFSERTTPVAIDPISPGSLNVVPSPSCQILMQK